MLLSTTTSSSIQPHNIVGIPRVLEQDDWRGDNLQEMRPVIRINLTVCKILLSVVCKREIQTFFRSTFRVIAPTSLEKYEIWRPCNFAENAVSEAVQFKTITKSSQFLTVSHRSHPTTARLLTRSAAKLRVTAVCGRDKMQTCGAVTP
ncbi:hypothetical protein Y1Q_0006622 [Alligator mississippiensis]|uniref:Uncharacterized protein n=1 Tax=Alligator mississippiensis TaxID=8496 RepID=A0A151P0L3_ALLMI|nr:hypothetical protein Y1Q_0006622 [Alligator mississippiensis]